jgi:hypothetical protein
MYARNFLLESYIIATRIKMSFLSIKLSNETFNGENSVLKRLTYARRKRPIKNNFFSIRKKSYWPMTRRAVGKHQRVLIISGATLLIAICNSDFCSTSIIRRIKWKNNDNELGCKIKALVMLIIAAAIHRSRLHCISYHVLIITR